MERDGKPFATYWVFHGAGGRVLYYDIRRAWFSKEGKATAEAIMAQRDEVLRRAQACKRERELGRANHWSYSKPRHTKILRDYQAIATAYEGDRKV